MKIKSRIGLAVGPVDPNHWGQVLVTPTAYGIVEVTDTSGNAQQKGAAFLSRLGEKLSVQLTSLSAIEQITDSVWEDHITSLIVLVCVGRVVYLVVRGSGRVFVKRGKELANLIHTQGGVSGEVRQADTILLVSGQFARVLSHADVVSLFDRETAPEVAEKLTLALHEKSGGEGAVALVFEVEKLVESEYINPEPVKSTSRVFPVRERLRSFWGDVVSIRHDPKRRRQVAVITVSLLFFLSVAVGIWKQTIAKKNEQLLTVVSDARHAFDEGVALLELNPVKGRERLSQAKSILDPVVNTVNPRTKQGRDVRLLYDQVNDNLTQSLQVIESSLSLFYDMELMKKGARATSLALSGTSLIIGDQSGGTVYRIDIETKKAEVVAGGNEIAGVFSVDQHGDIVYSLTPEGIMATNQEKKTSRVVPKHDVWGRVTSLTSFGGNLYLLDTIKSRIWKYTAVEKGFSDIREYLNPDTLPDLSSATNMTIDGSVWVGTKQGKIFRFVQGREETFIPNGVEPTLGSDIEVYVTDENINIYLLDRSNNRVVVLDKDGVYLSQYRFSAEFTVTSFVVSEQEKKILLLTEGKLYVVDLK